METPPETSATVSDPINSSRRNGKPASCEPCRISKTKCDHKYPKCDRCIHRGISEKCFYHPAPLTKDRAVEGLEGSSHPPKRKRTSKLTSDTLSASLASSIEKLVDAIPAETNQPGYLGPTSYEAILPKEETSGMPYRGASVESDSSNTVLNHEHAIPRSMRMQMVTDILRTLRHYDIIQEAIQWYHDGCHAAFIPLPLELGLINALRPVVDKFNLEHSVPDYRLTNLVLENSSRPLKISKDLRACDFHKLCSGDNIRLETISLVLSTAARAFIFGACHHLLGEKPTFKSQLIAELLQAINACIMICSVLSPVNDVTIWMLFGSFYSSAMVNGISAPPTWRRINEIATTVYGLGLHRESNTTNIPKWLQETRRRVFCAAYVQDKTISTFLGRPLRISKRHTDIKLPLDLSDEELVADEETLNTAINALGDDGWDTKGRYLRASWARLRYISSTYREEILDFALSKIDENVEHQLHDISRRIRESWDNLPKHLRYWPTCWDGLSPGTCEMLVSVYQSHWYNEFMVQKLLEHKQPLTSNTELLRVSTQILSTTLTLGTIRDRTYDIQRDFLTALILVGIPTASVLASALRDQQGTGMPFPPTISRAETIRMLSVLISHLDSTAYLESSSARLRGENYELCKKACKTFTRIVDNVLEPKPLDAGVTPETSEPDLGLALDLFAAPGLDAFEGLDFGAGDDGIDWGAMTQYCQFEP